MGDAAEDELNRAETYDDVWELTPCCEKCGNEMDWADCYQIDCEDGQVDVGEQDCINYAPGTYVKCDTCEGKGGWWYCPNKACSVPGE